MHLNKGKPGSDFSSDLLSKKPAMVFIEIDKDPELHGAVYNALAKAH